MFVQLNLSCIYSSAMIAKDLISTTVIPLKTSDTGMAALNIMEDIKVSHLPIVNNEEFLGLVSQVDIENLNTPDEALGNHNLSLTRPFVYQDQNIFEIIRLFSSLKLSMLPVLDRKNNYLGVITLTDLVQKFSAFAAAENPGGVIILELNNNDYSLQEIAQIIESNDAKVLSLYVTTFPDSTKIEISIKLNKIDIRPVLQTLYRYNYRVTASFSEEEDQDILKERFDSLMNYLNI
jgi:acetoin utilization protein AcuB